VMVFPMLLGVHASIIPTALLFYSLDFLQNHECGVDE